MAGKSTKTLRERFDDMHIPVPESGCWLWLFATDPKGYGRMRMTSERRTVLAHRVSWQLHRGEIPTDMFVCHKCDTPGCVNPDHLFLGTNADNAADMARKGRCRSIPPHTPGEKQWMAKLTEADVRAIRVAAGTQQSIADAYGIAQSCVSKIRSGTAWAHIA